MEMVRSEALGRFLFTLGWCAVAAILLAIFDGTTADSSPEDGVVLTLVGVALLIGCGVGARWIVDATAERAALIASLVPTGFAFPCMMRSVDFPLEADRASASAPIYSSGALLGIAALTLVTFWTAHRALRKRTADSFQPLLGLDGVLIGFVALSTAVLAPVGVATFTRPTFAEMTGPTSTHARLTVPELDASFGEEQPLLEDGEVSLTAVRAAPLPKRLARLTLDLHDGVGPRSVGEVVVGGGETLVLQRRGPVWEVCYPQGPRLNHWECTVLGKFARGIAGTIEGIRYSSLHASISPLPEISLLSTFVLFGAIAVAVDAERRRRQMKEIAGGRNGTLQASGLIESDGEIFATAKPLQQSPGPVVLLGVAGETDPYRGVRLAERVVPGNKDEKLRALALERLDMRVHVLAGGALGLAPAIATFIIDLGS
jgi:hypothetical protein